MACGVFLSNGPGPSTLASPCQIETKNLQELGFRLKVIQRVQVVLVREIGGGGENMQRCSVVLERNRGNHIFFLYFYFFYNNYEQNKSLYPNPPSPTAFILLSGVVLVSIKDISGDGIDIAYGDRPRVQGVSPMVSLYLPHSVYQLCPGCCGPHCPVIIHWTEAGGLTIVLLLPSKE